VARARTLYHMSIFEDDGNKISYEVNGSGFPVLLIAPGGLWSAREKWSAAPWNPVVELSDEFTVVSMDQRNAGASTAPISGGDGWHTYTSDQLALMDYLGYDSFHMAGMCIGGPYVAGMIAAVPERVTCGVMFQPIGLDNNRGTFFELFDDWAAVKRADHPDVSEGEWESFRSNMFGSDFMFNPNASRDVVAGFETPVLVLEGSDNFHPSATSVEAAAIIPGAILVNDWKEGPAVEAGRAAVREFLTANTP